MSDESSSGLTRREALRHGTLAGLGLVWAAPKVVSVAMTPQLAQATSGVSETTVPGGTTQATTGGTTVEGNPPENESTEATVEGITLTTAAGETTQGATEATTAVKDEVEGSQLPFTGFPLEQLLPLAGGAIATGAAAVRLARERPEKRRDEEEAES